MQKQHDGGCDWHIGSAVVLPEVLLKALALCRKAGWPVERFIMVNLDMNQHYRPPIIWEMVVERTRMVAAQVEQKKSKRGAR